MNELDKCSQDLKERFSAFDANLSLAREISRSAIYQMIILSASIVGFSVSLFSIPVLQSRLDVINLHYSWYFFLAAIILGFFILMFEGRIKYAITWKGFQVSQHPSTYDYSMKERVCAFFIIMASLFYPANLSFNGIYKMAKEKEFKERVNGLVVHSLAGIGHSLIFLENIFFILFICGLIVLVLSFV